MMSRNPGSRSPITRPSRNNTPHWYCLTIRTAVASTSSDNNTSTTRTTPTDFIAVHPSVSSAKLYPRQRPSFGGSDRAPIGLENSEKQSW